MPRVEIANKSSYTVDSSRPKPRRRCWWFIRLFVLWLVCCIFRGCKRVVFHHTGINSRLAAFRVRRMRWFSYHVYLSVSLPHGLYYLLSNRRFAPIYPGAYPQRQWSSLYPYRYRSTFKHTFSTRALRTDYLGNWMFFYHTSHT